MKHPGLVCVVLYWRCVPYVPVYRSGHVFAHFIAEVLYNVKNLVYATLMNNYSDEELVALAAQNNHEALETLVARYLKRVYSFAYTFVRNQADAEDITQDSFVKVWRNLSRFDQSKLFRPWLYQIARNTALDFLKKKSAIPFSSFDSAEGTNWLAQTLVDESQQPEAAVENVLLGAKLAAAAQSLAPKYAEVVVLRHNRDLSFREIAETIQEPINTVKSRYRRALLMLRKVLGA